MLLALGVALLASLSLFASLALGAKLPPENTALPVVSPTTPVIGKAETTTNGSWKNEPTSYTYAWLRCSTAGTECASIAGATSSSYTVVEADAGHTLVSAVTASNAYGKATAQSKATGRIYLPTQYWYSCQKGFGKVNYSDPGCTTTTEGLKGTYVWNKLGEASTVFTMNGTTPLEVEWTVSGIPVAVACSAQGEGTLRNPAGGAAGTASMSNFTLSACSLTKPEGQVSKCQVTGTTFWPHGVASELEGKPALRFEEASFVIQLSGASCAFGGYYFFSGNFTGVSNAATSSLEFSKAGGALLVGGKPAWFTGTIKIETKAGEALKLAS